MHAHTRTKLSSGTADNTPLTKSDGTALATPVKVNAGEQITYTYTVKNTGYVAISNVNVSDSHTGNGSFSLITKDATGLIDVAPTGDTTDTHPLPANATVWDTLGPGDTITFKATYTVTQDDVDLRQ
jgi:uncharacterized repeat protein (TIGR01451 family)